MLAHAAAAPPEAHAQLLAQLRRSEYTSKAKKPEIDWQDPQARKALLGDFLEDTLAVLIACQACDDAELQAAIEQLRKLVGQDIDLSSGQAGLRQGVAPDRQISTVDDEMRHGRKSASKCFNGYKGHGTVEPKSGLITGVAVTPASVHDGEAAAELVAQTQAAVIVGDNAYAGADVREQAMAQGVAIVTPTLEAKPFDKDQFALDAEGETMTCPAGATATVSGRGRVHFAAKVCRACPHRQECNPGGKGRRLQVHRSEEMQRNLRAWARKERELIQGIRAGTERVIGHWVRWVLREGRYFGRVKTWLQAMLAAIGHNLDKIGRHLAGAGPQGGPEGGKEASAATTHASEADTGRDPAPERRTTASLLFRVAHHGFTWVLGVKQVALSHLNYCPSS